MRILNILWSLLLISEVARCQLPNEDRFWAASTTARLTCSKSISYHNIGLGVQHLVDAGSAVFIKDTISKKLFLVTAEHVAKKMYSNTIIYLRGINSSILDTPLLNLTKNKDYLAWTNHATADVALVELDYNILTCSRLQFSCVDLENVENGRVPVINRKVHSVGFSCDKEFKVNFIPDVVEMTVMERNDGFRRYDNDSIMSAFITSDACLPGTSGGPLFELPTILLMDSKFIKVRVYKLIGINHGYRAYTKGTTTGAVTSGKYILELINMQLANIAKNN